MQLTFDRGGAGDRLLVLLHGHGATRHVWQPMLDANRWTGAWLAPDLRGHGASNHADTYTLTDHAGDVADLVRAAGSWRDIIIVGHSMGGAVALMAASGAFGVTPSRVFGLGIKVAWSTDELARMSEFASAPPRTFATEGEAIARYLKVSGLAGQVAEDSAAATAGVVRTNNGWRLAADPKTGAVGAPPMKALLTAAQAPAHLACGEADRMVTLDQLRTYDPQATGIKGAGHNAMIDAPAAVWSWIESHLS